MELYDNHNHSHFSFDGWRTTLEKSALQARQIGLKGICFSDHCDFLDEDDPLKEVFDVEAQQKEIDRVSAMIPGLEIIKGIEIGVNRNFREQIAQRLAAYNFDQIIASVHYIDNTDPFTAKYYEGNDYNEPHGHYLDLHRTQPTWLGDRFDIAGHFDYVVRYAPYPEICISYKDFPDQIDELLKFLTENGKALEINTKTYNKFESRTIELDPNILIRYREMGGELISFGSDSHTAEAVGGNFPYFAEYLKSRGFRYCAHYKNRKLNCTNL